jgi:phage shock protein PspC (stress-responsive transcriptional regulator)
MDINPKPVASIKFCWRSLVIFRNNQYKLNLDLIRLRYRKELEMKQQLVKPRLAKDSANGKITGVCAGLAKHYQLPRLGVRIGAVFALFMFPVVTAVAYVMASLLLPSKSW